MLFLSAFDDAAAATATAAAPAPPPLDGALGAGGLVWAGAGTGRTVRLTAARLGFAACSSAGSAGAPAGTATVAAGSAMGLTTGAAAAAVPPEPCEAA